MDSGLRGRLREHRYMKADDDDDDAYMKEEDDGYRGHRSIKAADDYREHRSMKADGDEYREH